MLRVVTFTTIFANALASTTLLAGYEPATTVTDHAGIAGDQAVIEEYLGFSSETFFASAKNVYEQGGNSKSFAQITLDRPLEVNLPKGTEITGPDQSGGTAVGAAYADYTIGTDVIGMQYTVSDTNDDYVRCKVGGIPEGSDARVLSGCLADIADVTDNQVFFLNSQYGYTAVEHLNGRTIQGFSTGANRRMRPGDDENADFFSFFVPFVNYYGSHDFGDKIVQAGFSGGSTQLTNGNIDLTGKGFDAREQIVKKGTTYIVILMYAIREMYDAIYDCESGCATTECNDDAVHALDEAVAFYVGNEHANDPNDQGNLAYALAEKRCKNFGTCADVTEGMSDVNTKIMSLFNTMKPQFSNGECADAEANVPEVVRLMMIPLIQGTLRYAYQTSTLSDPTETMQAEGAIFAAGILPNIHACDPDAATVIYNNMRLKTGEISIADFAAVKEAFESTYDCLGITCEDVGGVVDSTTNNGYAEGGAPCGGVNAFPTSAGAFVSASAMVSVFALLLTAFVMN